MPVTDAQRFRSRTRTCNRALDPLAIQFLMLDFVKDTFTDRERKRLLKRFLAIANGRDHITKGEFLVQPEVSTNQIIARVIDVVLSKTGNDTRRKYEGKALFEKFEAGAELRKGRICGGIHWEADRKMPAYQSLKKKEAEVGLKIEEVEDGGEAALRGQLQIGDRLIQVSWELKGAKNKNKIITRNVAGLPSKEVFKLLDESKKNKRTFIQYDCIRPESESSQNFHATELKDIDRVWWWRARRGSSEEGSRSQEGSESALAIASEGQDKRTRQMEEWHMSSNHTL